MWNKQGHIRAMEHYSAIEINGLLLHATIRMNLQMIRLSDIIQPPKVKYCDSIYMTFLKWKMLEIVNRWVVSRGEGGAKGGREMWVVKAQRERSLWWWKCPVSWEHRYQNPGCDESYSFGRRTIRKNWVQDLFILFLTTVCDSTII